MHCGAGGVADFYLSLFGGLGKARRKARFPEGHGATFDFGDAACADEEIRAHPEHRDAEEAQVFRFSADQRAHHFHRRQRIIRRHRDPRAVGDSRGEIFRRQAVPPTVRPSIFKVGCPTPTGTLWPSLPQVPMPLSSARSLPIMLTRVSASGPLPMRVAPFTGCVTLPSSMR